MATGTADKAAWRLIARDRRARRTDADRADAARLLAVGAADLARTRGWRTACAYVPTAREPGDLTLLDALRSSGTKVLLPVVTPDLDLDWAPYEAASDLAPGAAGLLEPSASTVLGRDMAAAVDGILLPALLVDDLGVRLGRGAGCYDRALTRVRPGSADLVAVVYDDEVVTSLPEEDHDVRATWVLTPFSGAWRVASPAPA